MAKMKKADKMEKYPPQPKMNADPSKFTEWKKACVGVDNRNKAKAKVKTDKKKVIEEVKKMKAKK